MNSKDMIKALEEEIRMNSKSISYLQSVYNTKQNSQYANTGDIYIPPVVKSIIDPNADITPQNQISFTNKSKQQVQTNMERLLPTKEALAVVDKLMPDEILTLNQHFKVFEKDTQDIKFSSVDEIVQYITTYVDKINNTVVVKKKVGRPVGSTKATHAQAPTQPIQGQVPAHAQAQQAPVQQQQAPPQIPIVQQQAPIVQQPIVQQPAQNIPQGPLTFVEKLHLFQTSPIHYLQDPAWATEPQSEKLHLFLHLFHNFTDVQLTKPDVQKFYNFVINDILSPQNAQTFTSQILNILNDPANLIRTDPTNQAVITKLIPNDTKTRPISKIQYKEIVNTMIYELEDVLNSLDPTKDIKIGRGLKYGKVHNHKAFKYGHGIENNFIKSHLFIELSKLNNNCLCIKYVKTSNIKIQLAVSENTKIVILQMLLNKFNIDSYNKLDEKEKKTISFFNHLFKLVDVDLLVSDPIEKLYTAYNILKGEINAGNDNPAIKKKLKVIAFELHKYKKINGSQLRNLIFELDN